MPKGRITTVHFDWTVELGDSEVEVSVEASIEPSEPDVGFVGGATLEAVLDHSGRDRRFELSALEEDVLCGVALDEATNQERDDKYDRAEHRWEVANDR